MNERYEFPKCSLFLLDSKKANCIDFVKKLKRLFNNCTSDDTLNGFILVFQICAGHILNRKGWVWHFMRSDTREISYDLYRMRSYATKDI